MKKLLFIPLLAMLLSGGVQAQTLISNDGGTNTVGGSTISWSIGEPIIGTAATTSGVMTQGYQQPTGKLIYYSRATGNVSDPIWSRTPTGPAGPANFIPLASMVVQAGHVVTNTATVDLRDVLVEGSGSLQLDPGSFFNIHGRNATFLGVLYGSDNSVMALVGNKPVFFTAVSKPDLWDLHVTTPQGTVASGEVDIRGTLQLNEGVFNVSAATFTLRSYATTTGRLGPVSPTASYTGNMKMERWIPGGATNWRLLGSPISNRRVAHWQDDFITAGYPGSAYPTFDDPVGSGILWPSIRWYDEANTGTAQNDGITGVSSHQQFLTQGQGFAAWSGDALGGTAPFIVDVHNAPPHIATSPISLPMSWTDTGTPLTDGWNLVSNPVPSAIAFDQIARGADVEDYVTFYNPANGNAAVYDISLGMGSNGATNTIQSSQGFFLKANGPNVATTVEESDKINDNGGGIFGGLLPDASPMLHLRIASAINSFNDEAFVVFDVGAPLLDAEDVVKYVFAHPAAPQVATLAPDGEQLAFNCFGALDAAFLVPVSVNAGVTGTYTITVDQLGELDLTCIVLKDLVTNTIITLTGSDSYSFFLDANDDPNVPRFLLKVVMPEAGFTASASSVEVGEEVFFSNASTNAGSYAWDFGDGTTSTEAEPAHAFASGGVFEVTLTATTGTCTASLTQTITVSSPVLPVAVRALLQGPYNEGTGLMNDALRSAGMLPMLEPYTAMGYAHIGGGGEFVMPSVFSTTGADAIVDWVVVELRSAGDPAEVVETRSGLLQRDGDIVAANGSSPLSFLSAPGSYHLAIRHRNHLGVMTHDPIAFGAAVTAIDFRDGGMATYGTEALALSGNVRLLWCGDVWGDGVLKYVGQDNDRDPILVAIGGTVPTSVLTGEYRAEDVNLDGEVKYVGTDNDRDPILQNIGGSVPTAVRNAQLP